jgi:hypothetical protein
MTQIRPIFASRPAIAISSSHTRLSGTVPTPLFCPQTPAQCLNSSTLAIAPHPAYACCVAESPWACDLLCSAQRRLCQRQHTKLKSGTQLCRRSRKPLLARRPQATPTSCSCITTRLHRFPPSQAEMTRMESTAQGLSRLINNTLQLE